MFERRWANALAIESVPCSAWKSLSANMKSCTIALSDRSGTSPPFNLMQGCAAFRRRTTGETMRVTIFLLLVVSVSGYAFASFADHELFIPAVGRVEGVGGAQFDTTVWITNPSSETAEIE